MQKFDPNLDKVFKVFEQRRRNATPRSEMSEINEGDDKAVVGEKAPGQVSTHDSNDITPQDQAAVDNADEG